MTSTDLQVLHTLYDHLFDAITYAPSTSQPPPFDKATSMIQFASMQAISESDFTNAFSPMNPNGDMRSAEVFSRMVNAVPLPQVLWADSGLTLSNLYGTIVNGANSLTETNPQMVERWNKAYHYLNSTNKLTDFEGNVTTQVVPSAIYRTYQTNLQSYVAALSSYRLTYNNYDLTDTKQQREWQAKEPVLAAAVTAAWNNLEQGGSAMVQQALAAMSTSVNDAVSNAIAQAQQTMKTAALASMTGAAGGSWYLAYATPTDWAAASAVQNMTQLSVTTKSLSQTADSSFTKWGSSVSAGWGLWSLGGSAGGSSGTETSQTTSTDFTMNANIAVVRIYRPWYDPTLFQMSNWSVKGYKANGVSDGNGGGELPMVPTALIVARDFSLSGTFSTEDKSHIESAVNGGSSIGWGPFQIGGTYSHSESHDKLNSTFDGTTLKVPGMQVIGYVNAITPACPPVAG